jgi:hypothetical protein
MEIRKFRGIEIIKSGVEPKILNESAFVVPSQSNGNKYKVVRHWNGWTCSCPDYHYRKVLCKHINAVEYWLKLREQLNQQQVFSENSFGLEAFHQKECQKKPVQQIFQELFHQQ